MSQEEMIERVGACKRMLSTKLLDEITACERNKSLGDKLLYEAGRKTEALKPTLDWIPWVVVDGVHSDKIQNDAENDLIKFLACYQFDARNDFMHKRC